MFGDYPGCSCFADVVEKTVDVEKKSKYGKQGN